MKTLNVELPEKLIDELKTIIEAGWFKNEDELVRAALSEFIRRHRFELSEDFQRQDIEWAMKHRNEARK